MSRIPLLIVALGSLAAAPAHAQSAAPAEGHDSHELAKKLSNPIADLVSVPFQFNWDGGVGPEDQTRFILNVQPVMPFVLTKDWNMILRVIVPLVEQPPLVAGGSSAFGVGDLVTSVFFAPSGSKKLIWGAGPVFSLPVSTEPTIGTEKWGAGPTFVVLKQTGPWTVGMLWNQVWSLAGNSSRDDTSQMFVQPFFAYQTKNLWTFTLQSESTANWKAPDDKWTVPVNLIASKLSSFGPFPASYALGFGVYAAHPDTGPSWKLRGVITILLPRKR